MFMCKVKKNKTEIFL